MEALQELALIALRASILLLVLSIGLDTTFDDAMYVFRRPRLLFRSLVAINIVVPAFAALIAGLLPLTPVVKAGIMFMAVSPLPPLVPGKELRMGGRKRYVYGLLFAGSVLSILILPLTVTLLAAAFSEDMSISPAAVARVILISVLLPVGIGMAIHRLAPSFSQRAAPLVSRLANTMLILSVLPVLIAELPAMMGLIGNGSVLAIAAVVVVGLLAGHVMGGPDPHDRTTLAIASATRHPGIALLIAGANFSDSRVNATILLFLVVSLLVSIPYQAWCKRHFPMPV